MQKNDIEIVLKISYANGNARLAKVMYSDSINIQDLLGILELYKLEVHRELHKNANKDNSVGYSIN